ncbi:hypothetical protein C8K44_10942 [Aminobacter sp. AP02]|nr:hypothetical protein C8K44_10942 [Aminobacter sp. AP02]
MKLISAFDMIRPGIPLPFTVRKRVWAGPGKMFQVESTLAGHHFCAGLHALRVWIQKGACSLHSPG